MSDLGSTPAEPSNAVVLDSRSYDTSRVDAVQSLDGFPLSGDRVAHSSGGPSDPRYEDASPSSWEIASGSTPVFDVSPDTAYPLDCAAAAEPFPTFPAVAQQYSQDAFATTLPADGFPKDERGWFDPSTIPYSGRQYTNACFGESFAGLDSTPFNAGDGVSATNLPLWTAPPGAAEPLSEEPRNTTEKHESKTQGKGRKRGRPRVYTVDSPESHDGGEPNPPSNTIGANPTGFALSTWPSKASTGATTEPNSKPARNQTPNARARNRVAATRYRTRAQTTAAELQAKKNEIETQNRSLHACADQLHGELFQLKSEVLRQSICGCPMMQRYVSMETQRVFASLPPNQDQHHSWGSSIDAVEATSNHGSPEPTAMDDNWMENREVTGPGK